MKINESMINSIATNLKTINNNIDTCISDIESAIKSIDSNWDGSASDEYKKNISASITAFKSYSAELTSSIGILTQTISDFEEMNQKLNSALSLSTDE